ncbi:MAG: hypothetical protein H6659_17270 [Ardenticatenaceae bacterium]|nr:hypothetical protein [Ardenticatenaceae bacterium]MCB8987321.1 hypothetical protein [Ardenticatenaceae bacterium]
MIWQKLFAWPLLLVWVLAACAPPPAVATRTAVPPPTAVPTTTATAPPSPLPTRLPATQTPPATATAVSATAVPVPAEHPVTTIPLQNPLARADAEISGLAWYSDTLIMLPQYPTFAGQGSFLYALPKSAILDYLDGRSPGPLTPQAIPFAAPGLADKIPGFQGYEAIAFAGDEVYLTVEADGRNGPMGYLVRGAIAPDLSQITVDADSLLEIAPQSNRGNTSDETLLVAGEQVVTLYEVNGAALNQHPAAHLFTLDGGAAGTLPMAALEYRVTDATAVDENGRFWVINYFFPGDTDLRPLSDPLSQQFGQGTTHQQHEQVERLVELQLGAAALTLTGAPPIQLQLPDDEARNWEGLVRLDERGFLLATDKFPTTILGFVPVSRD